MKKAMDRKTFYGEILVIVYTAGVVFLVTNDRHTATASSVASMVSSGDGDFFTSDNAFSLSSATKNGTSAQSTSAAAEETVEISFSLEVFTEGTTEQDIKLSSSSLVATTVGADETSSNVASSETEPATIEATKDLETTLTKETTTTGVITVSSAEASSPIVTPYTTTFSITTIETTILITTQFEATTAAAETPTTTSTTIPSSIPFETTSASSTTPTPTTTSTIASSTKPATNVPTIQTTTELNPCLSNPCRNQGNCTKVGSTSYSCSCVPGYTGHSCEIEINECESFPCNGFGKCKDLLNDYECTCNPGYTRNSSNPRQCIAIDFCSQSNYTCFNNGTCVNQPQYSRYYCQCPPSIDNKTYYTGLDCGNQTTTYPLPTNLSTKTGILAGGSRLTVTGRGLLTIVPFGAYFRTTKGTHLDDLTGTVDQNSLSDTSLVIISPRATTEYANRSLEVVLNYNGPQNVPFSEGNFTYQGDPVITDIRPTEILAAGGVNLTVTGSNMNVVTNPLMDITTIVFNASTKVSITDKYNESCLPQHETEMTCRIPVGIVPDAFLLNKSAAVKTKSGHALLLLLSPNWHRHRRQKREPIASLKDSETGSTFEMYLGFILDDLPTYENTSKSLPNIGLTLVTTLPIIQGQSTAEDFNPKTQTVAYIKGSNLTLGCTINDYTVMVGNETCSVTNLTNNEITYKPPKEKPATPDCDTPEGTFTVTVKVSTVSQKAYCLRYVDISDSDLALIIGVSVAGGVILLLLVGIFIYVMVKRQRRKNRKKTKKEEEQESDDSIAASREENNYEDRISQHSAQPDYLETLPDDATEPRLEGPPSVDVSDVTFHRQASSYYNENIVDDDELVPEADPIQRMWEYEPNDEALTFDLKHVKFDRATPKLPTTFSFHVDPRQSTSSFT